MDIFIFYDHFLHIFHIIYMKNRSITAINILVINICYQTVSAIHFWNDWYNNEVAGDSTQHK
jgi:hypothetical protein